MAYGLKYELFFSDVEKEKIQNRNISKRVHT